MSRDCLFRFLDCVSCGWIWSCDDLSNNNIRDHIKVKISSLNPSLALDNFTVITNTLGLSREEIAACTRNNSVNSLSPTYSIDRLVCDKNGSQCSLVSNGIVNSDPNRVFGAAPSGAKDGKSRLTDASSREARNNTRNVASEKEADYGYSYQQAFRDLFTSLKSTVNFGGTKPRVEARSPAGRVGRTARASRAKSWYTEVYPDSGQEDRVPVDDDLERQLKDEIAEVAAEMETQTGDESKTNPKTKQLSIGRKKFNMDPKKGIEYLIENGLLQNTPNDMAQFLYKGEGLNKTAIGDYLGERNDFNQQVLDAFVCLHDFTDLILVQALRQFLWSFRLPGEAQKIDRMMECFAARYCELNPSIFQHPDTCFVLSFAIIMLNTSLHNPAVKEKQTLDQFKSMNRGIDNGSDLPGELLASLYDSIKTEPFKIPEDDGNDLMHTFFNPDREGWLWKQGGRYKSWKRRWFILNDNCLYYFEYTTDKEPRGIIPLENIEVRDVHDRNKPHCFELYATSTELIKACKTDSEGKVVEGKHTVYRMSAHAADEKDDWVKCIRQSISHNPFYDLLAKRKKNILKNAT